MIRRLRAADPRLVVVGAVAVAVRLAYWRWSTPDWVPAFDADHYVSLARAMADGDGYSLRYPQLALHATAFRPPLYPLLLVPFVAFTDALWPARLLSVALGTAVAVLAAVLARRIAGPVAGVAAGLAVALCPPLVFNDTITLTEPLALLLLLVVVLLVDDERFAWAGLAAGGLLLTRPNAYLVVLLVGVVALRRAGWKAAAGAALAVLVVVVPWSVRNLVQVGTPRLVTSDAFTLAAIFAPRAQDIGGFRDPVFDPIYDADTELRLSQFDEEEWNTELLQRAVDGLRLDPGYVWENAGNNFDLFFELEAERNEHAETLDGRDLDTRRSTIWTFPVLTIGGLIGLAVCWRDRRVRHLWFLAVTFALLCIFILAPPRLRAPVDLICAVGFGLLVGRVWAAVAPRLPRQLATAGSGSWDPARPEGTARLPGTHAAVIAPFARPADGRASRRPGGQARGNAKS